MSSAEPGNRKNPEVLVDPRRYSPAGDLNYGHLDELENQSVFILREAFNKFTNLAVLWSVGKDSTVLLWLARKAFFGRVPLPCVHVDTSYKLPEISAFRERVREAWEIDLVVGQNKTALQAGMTFPSGRASRIDCCMTLKRDGLQQIVDENSYEAVILGIRRDEEGTRSKERYFSPRTKTFEWDVHDQPPELWRRSEDARSGARPYGRRTGTGWGTRAQGRYDRTPWRRNCPTTSRSPRSTATRAVSASG